MQRGTSLVELLTALVVMSIFVTVLFNALSSLSRNSLVAKNRAIALSLARDAIDDQVAQAHSGSLIAEGVLSNRSDMGVPVTFQVSRTNTQLTIGAMNDIFKVRVVVSWTNENGKADFLSLETWIKDGDA